MSDTAPTTFPPLRAIHEITAELKAAGYRHANAVHADVLWRMRDGQKLTAARVQQLLGSEFEPLDIDWVILDLQRWGYLAQEEAGQLFLRLAKGGR